MSETQTIDALYRARISIGSNEVLSIWVAVCPKCAENFRLLWPFWVLQIPLHRVVDLRYPFCRYPFSEVAASLASCSESEQLTPGLVEGLS